MDFLPHNYLLVYLNLSKCYIEDYGAKLIAEVLIRNNSIEYLNLSYNNLSEQAAIDLSLALKVNDALIDLNLCYNNIFEPSGEFCSFPPPSVATKKFFHYFHSPVIAVKQFFKAMVENKSIKKLNFAWNGLNGEDVGTQIGSFLKRNSTIECLDLSDNR